MTVLPRPNPTLEPDAVAALVLEALGRTDWPDPETGAAVVFDFAAPDLRRRWGSMAAVVEWLDGPLYRDLHGFSGVVVETASRCGAWASLRAGVRTPCGRRAVYYLGLVRSAEPPHVGCWLLEAIEREPDRSPVALN